MIEAFHFLRPMWLFALIPGAVLLWLLWRETDEARPWRGIVAAHLLSHLLVQGGTRRRWRPHILLGVVWAFAMLALAGPTWEREPEPFADDLPAMVTVVSARPTMLAQDVQPSRLARANQKMSDLMTARKGAQCGLIAYSGSAHLVIPLTKDASVVLTMLSELSPDIMPVEGFAAHQGVALACDQLRQSGTAESVLLITDDVTDAEVDEIRRIHASNGIPVHVFGMAAREGASVPADSPPAKPLDKAQLAKVAQAGGGELVLVTPDQADVQELVSVLNRATSRGGKAGNEGNAAWKDSGYWLVPLILLLALFWFRPGWAVRWPERM